MSTISPAMNLIIPTVGTTIGPTYAYNVNDSLTLIDQHDHTPGKGEQITAAGLNIDNNLPFNNHFATQLAGLTLLAQGSTPTLSTIYQSSDDLYFVDGIGNNIRLTQNGSIVGTAGSISGLVAPASASYVSGSSTFVWQSNTTPLAANMDFGAAIMRNLSPNSTYALTLQPPTLSSSYAITLPSLPAAQSFVTLDAAGLMSAPWTVDNTTVKIVSNQLVAQYSPLSPQREHSWELNGTYPELTYPLTNIDSIFFAPANIVVTSMWIYNGTAGTTGTTEFDIKGASPGGAFATMLSTTGKITSAAASNIWTDSGSVVGAQAGVTKPVLSATAIAAGQAIRFDLIQSMTGTATDARVRIFYRLS